MQSNSSKGAGRSFVRRDTMRSHLVLEVASELVDRDDWPYRQVQIKLKEQGARAWPVTLFGSDTAGVIEQVARGEVQVAIINPAGPLALALRGRGPFTKPIAVRAITVIPSFDQLAFAVTEASGLKSLTDIRERRFPLRVSLRGQMDHSVHLIVNEVLSAAGFSLADVVSWGGGVRYDAGLPKSPTRLGAVQRGEVDAIFDEAVHSWLNLALESGMRILPLGGILVGSFGRSWLTSRGSLKATVSEAKQRRVDPRFQRLSCLHARRCAGEPCYFNLFRFGGAQGKYPLGGRGIATPGPYVPRYARRAPKYSAASCGGTVLARARLLAIIFEKLPRFRDVPLVN
jgi:hypothetical protein